LPWNQITALEVSIQSGAIFAATKNRNFKPPIYDIFTPPLTFYNKYDM
jgi:hypothetical protein